MSDELRQIKDIAQRYTPEEIENCITQQVDSGENVCLSNVESERIVSQLSKAGVVRDFMNQGMSLADSLRELARRMRLLQSGFKELRTDK
jgi:hypothetical protein